MKVGEIWAFDFKDHFDSDTDQAWQNVSDVDAVPLLVRSVGFVVKVTKEAVVLSTTYVPSSGTCSATSVILRSTIVNSHQIKLPPRRRTRKESPNA